MSNLMALLVMLWDKLKSYVYLQVVDTSVNVTPLYDDPTTAIWASRKGIQPLDVPICGFSGKECPMSAFEQYKAYFIAAIVIAVVLVLAIAGVMVYIVHTRIKDIERQNQLWQVSFNNLVKMNPKVHSSKHFSMYMFHQDRVVGYKHSVRANLDKEEMAEFRQMRNIDHDNVNRFIGISLDGPDLMSIWRLCSRGSLRDVIANNTLNMDAFFVFSLMKDIVEGLYYLHTSFLQCHGYLKSSYCLVDDRWQVKLSNYGLTSFRRLEKRTARDQLWTAPELIVEMDHMGTKQGDIYSLALVCSEIVNMKPVWEPSETKGNPEGKFWHFFGHLKGIRFIEIVYLVKKGGVRPLRPLLNPAVLDLNPALLHLIRDCWADNPNDRPKIETVRSLMKSMVSGRTMNLMDHVFNMLEQYASTLEEEVEERTKELVEEKKKSDVLLYRMLPKQVAEKLKLGQSVEPETFDCVTIFFSDVVSFTTLASRCTPLQVVNLLNDLYTVFDGIIAEYDVYKVETIGDGYLCVSGLPHRNGNQHAKHIANMSLSFMKSLDRYTIPHLPGERISLRIGLHTGGVVTGVVGLAMPRYCLFGDTVNTASRMESNGKPNRIHLSADANKFITNITGGFITESRGEVIIKGKGVMETFWLVGTTNEGDLVSGVQAKSVVEDRNPPMYETFKKSQS
uniref:Guanylate cyclase n=1 Tax=Panagrolaimus superbus TaxID=310955 RepID=A0A914YCN1_9BILA